MPSVSVLSSGSSMQHVFYLLKDSYTIVKAISDMKTEKTMALIELLDHTRLISPGELMKMGK